MQRKEENKLDSWMKVAMISTESFGTI